MLDALPRATFSLLASSLTLKRLASRYGMRGARSFARRFIADQDAGAPEFRRLREKGAAHPIEATGKELRGMMAWVKSHDSDYVEGSAARG